MQIEHFECTVNLCERFICLGSGEIATGSTCFSESIEQAIGAPLVILNLEQFINNIGFIATFIIIV